MGSLRCGAIVLLLLMVAAPPGMAVLPAPTVAALAGEDTGQPPASVQTAASPLASAPAAGMRMVPGVAWSALAPGEFRFHCPTGPEGAGIVDMDDPTNNVNIVRSGCPFRIIDEGDLLGSPQLAVRHDDVDEIAFFSLHGGAAEDGPTPRSRVAQTPAASSGQTHTVFTSGDAGWLWQDNPYGREGLGETAAGIMTRDGNIFVASLFSKPLGHDGGTRVFDYHVRLHEERTVHDTPLAHRGPRVDNRAPGNQIEEVNLVLVTPPRYVENAAQYEQYVNATHERPNGTAAPSNDTHVGRYAMPREPGDHSGDLVAAVWHERAYDWRNASTGKSSWIHVMWRSAWDRDEWQILDDAQLIGPCRSASDPVAWNGRIYVACVVDAGYTGRRDARIGDVDIWAIDPAAGTKHFMSHVPGLGADGRPRLAADENGRFVISTTSIVPSGDVDFSSVRLAWGWYGREWDSAFDVGYQINEQWAPADLREARVTAMEIVRMDDKHVVFLSFMQRLNGTVSTDDPRAAAPIEYRKLVGSWEHCRASATALYDLNVGIVRHPFEEGLVNNLTGVFDDLHDGMAYVHDDATGMHLLHFAYGDHGAIQYGVVDARSAAGDCREELVPTLYAAAPPAPQAVLLPTGIGIGTALGSTAVAGLMLGSVLVAKRRVALAAAAKAK